MTQQAAQAAAIISLAVLAAASGLSFGGITRPALGCGARDLLLFRLGAALAVGADTGLLFFLLFRALPEGAAAWGAFASVCLLGAAALALHPLPLLPEDADILLPADRTQRRQSAACLRQILAELLLYAAWTVFLLLTPSIGADRIVLAFSSAALAGLLWAGRRSARLSHEWLEAIADKAYQAELVNFMQVIRAQRHDFNFHMQAVAGMIQQERYEACRQYIQTMVENVDRLNQTLPLRDPVVSALINTFCELALSHQIRLDVQAQDPMESTPCTTYEMNAILGNLLQNAIDEVEDKERERRWISLLLMKRSRQYIIKTSNPCDRDPESYRAVFHPGYSTKRSHEGIGLVTVRKIAVKYGGTVYLEHEPGVVHFVVKLPVKARAREQ